MKQDVCKRCGHKWYRRSPVKPKRCAGCGSPYWDTIKKNKKKIEYVQWLKQQCDRYDSIGDVAYDFMCDVKTRKFKSYTQFLDYLEEVNACDEAIEACKQSYKEYSEHVGLV